MNENNILIEVFCQKCGQLIGDFLESENPNPKRCDDCVEEKQADYEEELDQEMLIND